MTAVSLEINGISLFSAPIPDAIFLESSFMCFFHDSVSSIYTPRDLDSATLVIFFPSIQTSIIWFSVVALNRCLDPIIMYSVLVILRLSLFALSHKLRFDSSSFSMVLRSAALLAETVMLVSSAYIRGQALVKQFGRSLMYSKNSRGPIIDPWGTPQFIGLIPESSPFTWHLWYTYCLGRNWTT